MSAIVKSIYLPKQYSEYTPPQPIKYVYLWVPYLYLWVGVIKFAVLVWSQITLSHVVLSLIAIIRFMLSASLSPKVITISSF